MTALTHDFLRAVKLVAKGFKSSMDVDVHVLVDYEGKDTVGVRVNIEPLQKIGSPPSYIQAVCRDIRTTLECLATSAPASSRYQWVQMDYKVVTVWVYKPRDGERPDPVVTRKELQAILGALVEHIGTSLGHRLHEYSLEEAGDVCTSVSTVGLAVDATLDDTLVMEVFDALES